MSFLLQAAIAVYMIVLEGFRVKRKLIELEQSVEADPTARSRFYRFYQTHEWVMVGLIAVALWLEGVEASAIGLQPLSPDSAKLLQSLTTGLILGYLLPLVLALISKTARDRLKDEVAGLGSVAPTTVQERWQWVFCAVTGSITEEIRFRGFLTLFLLSAVPGLSPYWAMVTGAALFGMAHWYQGWRGVLSTGLKGAMFGALALYTGSLYPGIIIHVLLDLRLLAMTWAVQKPDTRAA